MTIWPIEPMEFDGPAAILSIVHAKSGVSIVPDLVVRPQDGILTRRLGLGPESSRRLFRLALGEGQTKTATMDKLSDTPRAVIERAQGNSKGTIT